MPQLIEGNAAEILVNAGAPVNGTDEVQLLTYTANGGTNVADSGTFTITFDGYTTTDLAFDASAATVDAALEALPSIGTGGCSVILTAGPPRTYQITFDGANTGKRNQNPVTTTTSLLQGAFPVNVVVTTTTPGVNATLRNALPGTLLIDTTNRTLYQNTSATQQVPTWTQFGTNATTSSAAELNFNDNAIAGTAVASKTAVLGVNKELDEFHTATLYLGAAAGTAVTATAAELNKVAASGMTIDGLGKLGIAHFTYNPTATAGDRTVAAHGTGITLPQYAIVVGGFFDVNTVFTSTNGTATVAISVEGANDIQTATAVNGAPYSTIGRKAIVPKANTPESTSVKTSVAREITCTVAGEALLGGKLTGFLYYVVSVASV